MVRRGRPVQGPQLAQQVEASALARQRLEVLLQTLSGARTIPEACAALGVGRSRFHALRNAFLQHHARSHARPRVGYRDRQRQLLADLKSPDRGHKRQRFKVLRLAPCPASIQPRRGVSRAGSLFQPLLKARTRFWLLSWWYRPRRRVADFGTR